MDTAAPLADGELFRLDDSFIGRWRRKQIDAAATHENWSQLNESEQATVALTIAHTSPRRPCYASQSYLASKLGVCRKTVTRHLTKAVRLGILACVRRVINHRRTTNLYTLAVGCWTAL